MPFCSKCGAKLKKGDNFCEKCGKGTKEIKENKNIKETSSEFSYKTQIIYIVVASILILSLILSVAFPSYSCGPGWTTYTQTCGSERTPAEPVLNNSFYAFFGLLSIGFGFISLIDFIARLAKGRFGFHLYAPITSILNGCLALFLVSHGHINITGFIVVLFGPSFMLLASIVSYVKKK